MTFVYTLINSGRLTSLSITSTNKTQHNRLPICMSKDHVQKCVDQILKNLYAIGHCHWPLVKTFKPEYFQNEIKRTFP